jgi:hypothetical protein
VQPVVEPFAINRDQLNPTNAADKAFHVVQFVVPQKMRNAHSGNQRRAIFAGVHEPEPVLRAGHEPTMDDNGCWGQRRATLGAGNMIHMKSFPCKEDTICEKDLIAMRAGPRPDKGRATQANVGLRKKL